jgi:hypothetical protein
LIRLAFSCDGCSKSCTPLPLLRIVETHCYYDAQEKSFTKDEELIFDDAVIQNPCDYRHFGMWLAKEGEYARFGLRTQNKSIAIDKAKLHYHELKASELSGKRYFSLTRKLGVERYLEQCYVGKLRSLTD